MAAAQESPAAACTTPVTPDGEVHALLRRSSFFSASSDEDLEERAFEPVEKVIASISGDPNADDEHLFSADGRTPLFSWRKLWLFTGPGFLLSIAFLDPGDLQAGATAGDTLPWLLLWAMGLWPWGSSCSCSPRGLGWPPGGTSPNSVATSTRTARRALWIMAEVSMVNADIQEVIGSAIAIKILSRGFLPLWAGVVITALYCFIFLSLENYGVRKLEDVFAVLIATMAWSFSWMFIETKPNGKDLINGIWFLS